LKINELFFTIFQTGKRGKSTTSTKKSIAHPEKYMSLIVDGMDQGKTHLPHCSDMFAITYIYHLLQSLNIF
jgi:hypothetical protein